MTFPSQVVDDFIPEKNTSQEIYSLEFISTFWRNISLSLEELEQLERLCSEDTPRRPVITHTIDQFVLNPKYILLTSSYWIPSQKKVKAKKIRKICEKFKF